jgi:16S rRNA (guanine527-N7)-methyltransferase
MLMTLLPHHLWADTLPWQPDPSQIQLFDRFYNLVIQANEQLNLTRIVEPEAYWEKHLWDSLRGIVPLLKNKDIAVLDLGTGGGFPGMPIAIMQPTWYMMMADSTRKKTAFINNAIQSLGISNAQTITGRAEELGHKRQQREGYDLVVLRAVAPANVCAEYGLPFAKVGGRVILYRGTWEEREAQELERAAYALGAKVASVDAFTLPITGAVRHCIHLLKIKPTLEVFPREVGTPTKYPIGALEDPKPSSEPETTEEPL